MSSKIDCRIPGEHARPPKKKLHALIMNIEKDETREDFNCYRQGNRTLMAKPTSD